MRLTQFSDYALRMLMLAASMDGKPFTIEQAARSFDLSKTHLNKVANTLTRAGLLKAGLWIGKKLGLTQYGPEQLDFLRYRPVLLNTRLKEEFGYVPKRSSAEVFELYRASRQPAR